ncbi:hypothetical protein GX408_20145 [bacterium]|nr:hypothetical protein [bacterium]
MSLAQGFWALITAACVLWYLTVTLYVAVRGLGDIRRMLQNLSEMKINE